MVIENGCVTVHIPVGSDFEKFLDSCSADQLNAIELALSQFFHRGWEPRPVLDFKSEPIVAPNVHSE